MKELYLLPSLIASLFLISIAIYLLFKKPRKRYIFPLVLLCLVDSLWNIGVVLTNVTDGGIVWAELTAVGLIFLPAAIFHFTVEYTKFFKDRYYLLAYAPACLLTILLPLGYYVTGVEYKSYGFEAMYSPLLFSINSCFGLSLTLFSVFMLLKYYRASVGIKKQQILYILFAIPANSLLSFISYEIMVEILHIAQFPVGAILDLIMISLIVYAILRFKLPVETAAEIDFRILSETASEGICIVDSSGSIDYANSHFSDLVDTPNKKIIGKQFQNFISEKFSGDTKRVINRTMKGEKTTNFEIELMQGDGTLNVEINTSPIVWNDKIIGGFVTLRNVTERKKTERELKEQKTYFQALFEGSPEAIVSLDGKHRVIDVNPSFVKLFGYKLDEMKGKNIDDFILSDEKEKEGRAITKKVLGGETVMIESLRKRKDGSLVPVSIIAAPIFIDDHQVGIFGIYRDVTEKKEAEEEKEFYNSLLRHDVANRNMVVQGNLEILDSISLNPEQKSLVSNALNAAVASTDLIKKIRELRAAEGESNIFPVIADESLSRAIKVNLQQAEGFAVEINYGECDAVVKAGSLVDNIFSNIIQNAIVHAQCKKISICCNEEKINGKKFCKVSVKDDGKGIPDDLKKEVFKPGIKRRGSPGSGLGLYLVRKLVEKYGGWIEIEDRMENGEKRGTIFNIYLELI
ncbi:MAG: PAS domain S-box protein [Candidatus Thermoplasmatota archaeon]|nr:PAS domain S-box protein [Candidatus Thermoplasmatota archaeon]